MERLAAGIMIAVAALVMNGGLIHDALAEDIGRSVRVEAAIAAADTSRTPVAYGLRSELVLSLLLTLEALRAAPALLDTPKV